MTEEAPSSKVPDGWHSVTPRLVAHDPVELVNFLKRAFDATGEYATEAPTVLKIGDSNVMVSASGPRSAAASFLHLYVADADATFSRAVEAGATVLEPPSDMPYGDRRAMVRDPSGNDWQIATYRAQPS
jgi:uncharacterized glyoxalase superfamily protein PhnB